MGIDDSQPPEVRIRELIADIRDSPMGQRLSDVSFRRQHAYEALTRNADPVLREIGEQLRDGRMRPADILRVPAYREAFQQAAEQAAERLDPAEIAEQLETLAARARDERVDGADPTSPRPRGAR
jgi:hypothetical protein